MATGKSTEVQLLGMTFENPVLPASGPLVEGLENLLSLSAIPLGGLITKTISVFGATVKKPCILGTPHLIYNSELWSERDLGYWIEALGRFSAVKQKPLGVSVGYSAGDLKVVMPALEGYGDFFEVSTHYDKDALENIVKTACGLTDKPVLIKLSPQVVDPEGFVERALRFGASGIVAVNSFGPGLVLDLGERRAKIGIPASASGVKGFPQSWVSGPAIKPFALERVARLRRQFPQMPLIACGGVETAQDVLEMIMAGADLVQVLSSALLQGRKHYQTLISGLEPLMVQHQIPSIKDLRETGFSSDIPDAQVPQFDNHLCSHCGKCLRICPFFAIEVDPDNHYLSANPQKCIQCGLCESLCPVVAISGTLTKPSTGTSPSPSPNPNPRPRP